MQGFLQQKGSTRAGTALYVLSEFQSFEPLHSLDSSVLIAECGESEPALAVLAKAYARCADYVDLLKQQVKELPAAHAVGALHPQIWRILASAVPDACHHRRTAVGAQSLKAR